MVMKKLMRLRVRCEFAGCGQEIAYGNAGANYDSHAAVCDHAIVICPDCKQRLRRRDMLLHKPATAECMSTPMDCDGCKRKVPKAEWKAHLGSDAHRSASIGRVSAMLKEIKTLLSELEDAKTTLGAARVDLKELKESAEVVSKAIDGKLAAVESRCEAKLAEQRVAMDAVFCEFEISKWYR